MCVEVGKSENSEDFLFEQDSLTCHPEAKKRTRVSEIVILCRVCGVPTRVRKPPIEKIAGPTHKKPSFPYPSKACNFTFNSAASLRAHASAGVKFARVPRQVVRHSNTVDPRA